MSPKKFLYGLKQASRAWNARIDGYHHQNGHHGRGMPELMVIIIKTASPNVLMSMPST